MTHGGASKETGGEKEGKLIRRWRKLEVAEETRVQAGCLWRLGSPVFECKMKELGLELGHDVTVLGSRAQASSSAGTGVGSRPHR